MYDSLTFEIKTDIADSNVKWASFTHNGVRHEIRPALDESGNVDNAETLKWCKDHLESFEDDEETV